MYVHVCFKVISFEKFSDPLYSLLYIHKSNFELYIPDSKLKDENYYTSSDDLVCRYYLYTIYIYYTK